MNEIVHSVSSINQSSNFNNLSVYINDIELKPELITEISLDFDGTFEIYGNLTFNDYYDIHTQANLDNNSTIIITLIDLYDDIFTREFKILNVAEEKIQDFKILKLSLQDIVSFKLKNTYIDKSFKETSLSDIFKYYMSLEVDSIIEGYDITKRIQDTDNIESLVVPLNTNFLDFITIELHKYGIFFYQTPYEIILGNFDIPKGEYVYKQVGAKDLYGFSIMEHKLLTNNLKLVNFPKTYTLAFNKETKTMDSYIGDFDLYKDIFNYGEAESKDLQVNSGFKLNTKEYLVDTEEYKMIDFKNTNILSIVVPGNIKQNKLYSLVQIDLSGNRLSVESKLKGDEKMSGLYEICRIETKIILGQKIVNKLTLKRTYEGKIL